MIEHILLIILIFQMIIVVWVLLVYLIDQDHSVEHPFLIFSRLFLFCSFCDYPVGSSILFGDVRFSENFKGDLNLSE